MERRETTLLLREVSMLEKRKERSQQIKNPEDKVSTKTSTGLLIAYLRSGPDFLISLPMTLRLPDKSRSCSQAILIDPSSLTLSSSAKRSITFVLRSLVSFTQQLLSPKVFTK
jgi:hypothetical protein